MNQFCEWSSDGWDSTLRFACGEPAAYRLVQRQPMPDHVAYVCADHLPVSADDVFAQSDANLFLVKVN